MKSERPLKIYISLPITGHSIEAVHARIIFAKGVIEKLGHEAISPLDNAGESYGECMGQDIATLLDHADAALFLDGWHLSKGCALEFAAANLYGKTIFLNYDQIPPF